MSLGYKLIIHLRASEAGREIKAMAEFARRSIGQRTRWARVKIAAIATTGRAKP